MGNGDSALCDRVRGALKNSGTEYDESEVQHATKLTLKAGAKRASILVFNTGRLHVEGAESDLKSWLVELKASIETGAGMPGMLLGNAIERFPQVLRERVPKCDLVVLWYYDQALRCLKVQSTAGAAFMLGAASEKAILLLIETYASRIGDEKHRLAFEGRVKGKMISGKYDEFKRSYKAASPRPKDGPLAHDLEQLLDGSFNIYRHTRNGIGHPQVIPDLDESVVQANLGNFITYVARIYDLMEFFQANTIEV